MTLEERIILTASKLLEGPHFDQSAKDSIVYCVRLARDIFCEKTLESISSEDWLAIILAAIKSRNHRVVLHEMILEKTIGHLRGPQLRAVS